jgi:nucleotide-binding universal stress UspA family protein
VFLVPLDGTTFAEAALPDAVELARVFKGSLLLVHVHRPPFLTEGDIYGRADWAVDVLTRDQTAETAYLADVSRRMRDKVLRVQTVIRSGEVSQALLEEGWDEGASLIVMATHGRAGLGEVLHGSVALDVLHSSKLPLLLVRPSSNTQTLSGSPREFATEPIAVK